MTSPLPSSAGARQSSSIAETPSAVAVSDRGAPGASPSPVLFRTDANSNSSARLPARSLSARVPTSS